MSRPISESLSLLNETLGNCKTNLKEKEVADVDNIKISDVDEKIAEIQVGGGDTLFKQINFSNIQEIDSCKIELIDNKTFKIIVDVPYSYQNTQLYLCNMDGNLNGALNKTSTYRFETNNMDIDTFINNQREYAVIHANSSYSIVDDNKTPPCFFVSLEK